MSIDYAPTKNCTNSETYGVVCVKCNTCGRFNCKCLICNKVIKPKDIDKILWVELYDVFEAPFCIKHKDIIEKHGEFDNTYKKYFIGMRKKEFLKIIKNENK